MVRVDSVHPRPALLAAGEIAMPAAITVSTPTEASTRPNQPVGPAGIGVMLIFDELMGGSGFVDPVGSILCVAASFRASFLAHASRVGTGIGSYGKSPSDSDFRTINIEGGRRLNGEYAPPLGHSGASSDDEDEGETHGERGRLRHGLRNERAASNEAARVDT